MSEIKTLLPPSTTATLRAIETVMAEREIGLEQPITTLWNPDTCPAALLGWLAWSLSVDVWDATWSEEAKRQTIRDSIAVHREKGTVAAVKRVLKAAGYNDAEVIERFGWETYDGAVAHDGSVTHAEADHWAEYRVRLTRPISIAQADQVRRILANVAPVRCRLKALLFDEAANLYNAAISHDGQFNHGVA
jgi:phage tail P2-like protein